VCSAALSSSKPCCYGTTATTYTPAANVTREQMSAFVTRTLDQSLKRGHPRAALGEWWTSGQPIRASARAGQNPRFLACDGSTVWASNTESNTVTRVDIRTHKLICTLTGIPSPEQIVIVSGNVYVASYQSPGAIYVASISDTTDAMLSAQLSGLGDNPVGITYDGQNLWTANEGTGPGSGSITKVSLDIGGGATTITQGFSQPVGILFDGANLWVTDQGDTSLKRVNTATGAVLQTIPLSGNVGYPIFDGTNLWIPCGAQSSVPDKVFVVRAVGVPPLLGTVLAQLTGNGLNGSFLAAFDGERICVSNSNEQTVSLWKATDLSPIGSVTIVGSANFTSAGVCSDGKTVFVGLHRSGLGGLILRL
jgi:hypothetical protein